MIKSLSILGSTGSIGTQTLDVARKLNIKVNALSAYSSIELLEEQIREFRPALAVVFDADRAEELKIKIADTSTKVLSGMSGLHELCHDDSELIVNAIVGMVGLEPTLEAIKAKKDIAFANKETLVAGGALVMDAVKEYGVKLLPVDSEHSAIFQCLQAAPPDKKLKKILLTASGGPFRGRTLEEMRDVTIEQALNHPKWSMGSKITIDSATMMNKGLEVIEARWLFDVPADKIDVHVHPESIVHSMVEFCDGSVIAQMGMPDMKIPISLALSYPDRMKLLADFADGYGCDDPLSRSSDGSLDLFTTGARLTFEKPDRKVFRCIDLAYEALKEGGAAPVVMNGANEELVAMFLAGKIGFLDIPQTIEKVMDKSSFPAPKTVEEILETDRRSREMAKEMLV